MRILALADEEEKSLYDYWTPQKTADVDLILSCGDLHAYYLEYLVTVSSKPVLYVRGNHDENYEQNPPLGCDSIDGRLFNYKGLRILGLGGSVRYRQGTCQYTEEEMEKRIRKLRKILKKSNGFDILLTHAPAKGYGDMDDLAHRGFDCFNELLEEYRPAYLLHGHVHKSYSSDFQREHIHPSGTCIINCYGSVYLDVDVDPSNVPGPEQGRFPLLQRILNH